MHYSDIYIRRITVSFYSLAIYLTCVSSSSFFFTIKRVDLLMNVIKNMDRDCKYSDYGFYSFLRRCLQAVKV